MANVLYISYDGLTDSLGQSQIIPYLSALSGKGHDITIISFEKKENYFRNIETIKLKLASINIHWINKWYTKNPPIVSTLFDILICYLEAKKIHKLTQFTIIHCRGYISSLVGLKMKKYENVKFIFDMRGWWPDEKIESGSWSNWFMRPVYSYFKKIELQLFSQADFIVSLTERGKHSIIDLLPDTKEKIGVVPTCVDFKSFPPPSAEIRSNIRTKLNIPYNSKVFVYSGSLGGNYELNILVDAYLAFKKSNDSAHLLILSKDSFQSEILDYFQNLEIPSVTIINASHKEVSDYLRSADIGLVFYKSGFSLVGRCPTKLGEYWASGLPVISFMGVGDLDALFVNYIGSGVLLSSEKANWPAEMSNVDFADTEMLRYYAYDYFNLEKGVIFYDDVYNSL